MASIPHPEQTIADVLAALHMMDLRQRTQHLELQAELSTLRLDVNTRFDDIRVRLATLFDELAAFRAEYNQHTHE